MDPGESLQSSASPRNRSSKACANCARIKCKCIPRADGTGCERCHRLHKTCAPSPVAQRRRPKRNIASRSARLEEKLDDLVSILRAQHNNADSAASDDDGEDSEIGGFEFDDTSPSSTTIAPTIASGEAYTDEPSLIEAEDCLRRFRDDLIPFTPFIHIPLNISPHQLRQKFPFLWLNIMSVTSKSPSTRTSLNNQVRSIILHRLVAGSERSLDLLLGILTFVNWVHMFPMDKRFVSLASQLAVTLIWDLGLQMPTGEGLLRHPSISQAPDVSNPASGKERSLEEKRTVLGAFVITSLASQTFKAAEGLQWSPYLEEYLNYLSHHSTVPLDKILVGQVKIRLIFNQVRRSSSQRTSVEIPPPFVDALLLQLDGIARDLNGISFQFGSRCMGLCLFHFTTLMVHESAMVTPRLRDEPDIRRYEVYERCLNSIKSWLDMFFAIPFEMYPSVPCSIFCQLFYVMGCLHKTSTTRDTSWNPATAREIMDLIPTLDRIIKIFEQLIASTSLGFTRDQKDSAITFSIKKFQALKAAWQMDLASNNNGASGAFPDTGMVADSQGLYQAQPMDYFGHMLPGMLDDLTWP